MLVHSLPVRLPKQQFLSVQKDHGWVGKKSEWFRLFEQCSAWKEIVDLFQTDGDEEDLMRVQINSVGENNIIIRKADNRLPISFKNCWQ